MNEEKIETVFRVRGVCFDKISEAEKYLAKAKVLDLIMAKADGEHLNSYEISKIDREDMESFLVYCREEILQFYGFPTPKKF